MKTVLLGLLLAPCLLLGAWQPDEKLLAAVRQIESSGGKFTRGDEGRSLGDFQIGKAAWTDVNASRKARGLQTYTYRGNVMNRTMNRLYAAEYLSLLRRQLVRRLHREPSAEELYAAYNMGFSRFERCAFKVSNVNGVTARKCQQVAALCRS